MALWWWGTIASMKARSKGSGAVRSVSTSWAMFIVPIGSDEVPISWSIGIWSIEGVWSLPYQARRQAFIWLISSAWLRLMSTARLLISGCSARISAISAISMAAWWWGTIMSMNC